MSTVCYCCGQPGLDVFYRASDVPVHSVIQLRSRREAVDFPTGDLALGFCSSCGFIQNQLFDPSLHDYSRECEESQAFSPRFNRFAEVLAERLVERYDLRNKRIVEIGCGKGDFLMLLARMGPNVAVGIDPGAVPERVPPELRDRVQLIREFYSQAHSEIPTDLIACRHTLEHIQDVSGFVSRIRHALQGRPETPVFFEVPASERVLDELAFWDIYYEHCSYFSTASLSHLFERSGFLVEGVEEVFGRQYLVLFARAGSGKPTSSGPDASSVADMQERVERFRSTVGDSLSSWRARADEWRSRGERVVLWGSSSKAVSFLTTLALAEQITGVVDVNPFRQGGFMPGTGHAIWAPDTLIEVRPSRIIVMNPVYVPEIRSSLAEMGLDPELEALGQ